MNTNAEIRKQISMKMQSKIDLDKKILQIKHELSLAKVNLEKSYNALFFDSELTSYLFQRKINNEILSLQDLTKPHYEFELKPLAFKTDLKEKVLEYKNARDYFIEINKKSIKMYKKYEKNTYDTYEMLMKLHKKTSNKELLGIATEFKPSTGEQKIIHILDNIPNIVYFYKHRWELLVFIAQVR